MGRLKAKTFWRRAKVPPKLRVNMLADALCWDAIQRRDASFDREFVFAVKTTGVFCLPSCRSRLANRNNVRFFQNADQATAAGFRPCKRCLPGGSTRLEQEIELVSRACRLLEETPTTLEIEALAIRVAVSTASLRRMFRKHLGVSPKEFSTACRRKRLQENLVSNESVTAAYLETGFASASSFYNSLQSGLGMRAKSARELGKGEVIRFAVGECRWGSILVAATEQGVCAIDLGEAPETLRQDFQRRFAKANLIPGDAEFERWMSLLIEWVDGQNDSIDVPLDLRGTLFQQQVWKALQQIPRGSILSYTELAKRLGRPEAVRAVAGACGANPLAVVIPCHRVVARDGKLTGYRWGINRKAALLQDESSK